MSPRKAPSTNPDWNASGAQDGIASSHACFHEDGRPSAKYRIRKISGRLRNTSTHVPATQRKGLNTDRRASASSRPTISAKIIAMIAIWRLMRKPSRMNRALLPVHSHSQLSGLKR